MWRYYTTHNNDFQNINGTHTYEIMFFKNRSGASRLTLNFEVAKRRLGLAVDFAQARFGVLQFPALLPELGL